MEGAVRERTAVRAIVITPEHHVLLMRIRPPGETMGFWITPGGGIEAGETDEGALRRELGEELGLTGFERFEPSMSDATEARILQEFRWWHVSELAHAEERLTPLSLPKIVSDYLTHGAPRTPPELEVLGE